MKLTKVENRVKKFLESMGWVVVKPAYPDFLVCHPVEMKYCFVEVKSTMPIEQKLTKAQEETFELFNRVGLPTMLWYDNGLINANRQPGLKELNKKAFSIPTIDAMSKDLSNPKPVTVEFEFKGIKYKGELKPVLNL